MSSRLVAVNMVTESERNNVEWNWICYNNDQKSITQWSENHITREQN